MKKTLFKKQNSSQKVSWHFWLIAIASLIWNSFGAMDFIMSMSRNEAYMSSFSPEQLAYFYSFPIWVVIAWAIGVWGSVLGSLFLLLRKSIAIWMFYASFAAVIVTTIYNYVLTDGLKYIGDTFSLVFTAIIILVALFLCWYSTAMKRKNVLV